MAPGHNESADKRKSGKTPYGNKALKTTLAQCAKTAAKNKKTFFAQYSRLTSHGCKNRATMAVAHSMAIVIFCVLSGADFHDLGADYYTQFNREKKVNSHIKQLTKLDIELPVEVLFDIYLQASSEACGRLFRPFR